MRQKTAPGISCSSSPLISPNVPFKMLDKKQNEGKARGPARRLVVMATGDLLIVQDADFGI